MKRILSIMLIVSLVSAFSACGRQEESAAAASEAAASEATESEVFEEEEEVYEDTSWSTSESSMEESISESEEFIDDSEVAAEIEPVEEEDELAVLKVTEEFARMWGGVYLRRNGNIYSLRDIIMPETSLEKNVGWYRNDQNAIAYRISSISLGDIPLPELNEGDEIITFGCSDIALKKAEFLGYSPCIWTEENYTLILPNSNSEIIQFETNAVKQFEVRDQAGNLLDDYHNLNYGDFYTISWFSGTDYNEIELCANCRNYNILDSHVGNYDYEFEGYLHKEEYASYDFTGVEPGIYSLLTSKSNRGFIKIN